ncbi:hypothetical protein PUN28_007126 [Cardiocondyla obscurior]|uniref:Pericentrin/AKAP-450 centrosomal targeting domain-containing protein n=1 Tax=Cardiocondyla obscurior TaxID=286306 RepID=A0AAW2G3C5_9HYME
MSATQDEEERRKRSLEAGREMLEKYKAKQSNVEQVEQSDDEMSLHNERSMLQKESGVIEGISSRDITYSSVSISEGEADADLDGLAGRVAELEELLHGKEAIVGTLNEEIDNLRAETCSPNSSQSQGSSALGRDIISLYHIKLQEFEKAVTQRDTLIEHLTSSLEQALSARDVVTAQLNALNSMQINPEINNMQQKIEVLETTMNDQEALIRRLTAHLTDIRKHVQTLEMERETRNAEINDYKIQINNLNEQIRLGATEKNLNIDETLEQQKHYETRIDKIKQDMQHILNKFTTAINTNTTQHQQELKELTAKNEFEIMNIKSEHEKCMKILKDENKMLADRLNKELPDLESRHAKELSVFQTQLTHYKKTIEALKIELVNHAKAQKTAQSEVHLYKMELDELKSKAENDHMQNQNLLKEKDLLNEQIKLHKIQLEEITSKHIALVSILESKESIERSLEQALSNAAALKKENDSLKFKLDDLSCKYSAAQSLMENSQLNERTFSDKLYDIEKSSLSRFDTTSVSTISELGETMYKPIDEEAVQQLIKRRFEEKVEVEKLLVEKIHNLEASESDSARQIEAQQREIESLKLQMEEKETENTRCKKDLAEVTEKAKEMETQCEKLTNGLALALAQCSKFEEKLNETLAMNDSSKINISLNTSSSKNFKKTQSLYDSTLDQNLESSNKISDSNIAGTLIDNSYLKDNDSLYKELQQILEGKSTLDEIKLKLSRYYALCEKITSDKQFSMKNAISQKQQISENSLQNFIENLLAEKESLTQEIEEIVNQHKKELESIKLNSTKEIDRLRSMLQNFKDGNASLNDLRNELEARHAKEMEELRTYFERKCLQMEKQYSEEIFSQQSKRVSDNDSETEELTDDLYFGGAGDCLNVSNSRVVTSNVIEEEALRQELEQNVNEIQNVKANYEKTIEEQKKLYECQIRDLEIKLKHALIVPTIHQALLSVEGDKEDSWPAELLELRDKFTCNAKQEIQELKKIHSVELARLKDEHSCIMTKMLEEHQKEIDMLNTKGKQEVNYVGDMSENIIKERDNLWKTCVTLKNLIGELVTYFVACEDEVNNTLINEVFKNQLTENTFTNDENLSKNSSTVLSETQHKDLPTQQIKKVHFAPQSTKIVSIINGDKKTLQNLAAENIDETLKKELKACLRRFKSDSNQILNLSLSDGEDKVVSTSNKNLASSTINEELSSKLNHTEILIMNYEEEIEQLKSHIFELQRKLISAENKKEVITEGYGESDLSRGDIILQDFSQIQEKARHVLSNGGGDASYLLQLIEELCRQYDKLIDDARKEREDLQQQIEAADKQLRATRRFLDEQASEREMERDEAAKQIHFLQEQLKERERDKERDMRITSESELSSETTSNTPELRTTDVNAVEALESQMREMSSLMSDTEAKKSEKESELKAAVDKIWVLRDIIADLEQQLQVKNEKEESLQMQINQLETVITAQTKNQHELVHELDAIKSGSESRHLTEQINHLQEELNKHKLSSEHFNVNSSVLKQMKAELHEMQNQLDKRIREMESAHMCGSNLSLSHPSEDVSIREQIDATRCLTPDDPSSPPMLPLDQVLKLKDKMLKHARAEEVAFKRIKDLEMQLTTMKNQNEELLAEQEILQQTASEQLFQIEAMRGRLEQHKQSAPFAQKQATSRLELQLHEATTKYHSLEQTITDKEIESKELKAQLERANQLLAEKEAEMENLVQSENFALQKIERLKDQLKFAQEEKKILQMKLGTQEHTQLESPQLIDTMLADKNEEIDYLKEQLSKKEKQLSAYSLFALDDVQLKELTKQAEAKNSARTLSDILSIHSECEEFPEAVRAPNATHVTSHNVSSFKVPTSASKSTLHTSSLNTLETHLLDVDKIDAQVPLLDLHFHTHSDSNGNVGHSGMELRRSEEESKLSSPKNNDTSEDSGQAEELLNEKVKEVENLMNQLQALQQELHSKSDLLSKCETELFALQKQYQNLQDEFKETVENLVRDKNFYKGQYELAQASESKIKKDLEEVENILKLKTDEFEDYKNRMQVNERIITELNAENTNLKREIEIREKDQIKKNIFLTDTTQELQRFKELILDKDIALETLQTRNIEIENENKQLYDFKTKVHAREREISEMQDEILRLTDGLNNRDQVIRKLEEMARRMSDVQSGTSSPLSSSNKDQEIHHLQEFLKEKDKVIRQMSDDSKSLHRALETIQSKMKESGNIVELRRKLKEERRLNEELRDTVQRLQKELEDASARRSQDNSDIEDMVQRELNLSVRLDKQLMQLKTDLTEKGQKIVKLEKELSSERDVVKFLRMQIEEHRRVAEEGRIQDTELIEFLQTKLKASLDNEEKLRNDLASMRQQQINLDSQLTSMRKLIENENMSRPAPNFAATAENDFKRANENFEESREHTAELQENIKRLENELSKYEKQLEIAMEEQERLISSLTLINGAKEILETDLRRTMKELKAREEDCNYLQKQLKMLTESKKRDPQNSELDEIKELRSEINTAREVKIKLETDINRMKQELKGCSNRELKLLRTVNSLKEREAELNAKLAISKDRERKFKDLIENVQDLPTAFLQKMRELSNTAEKFVVEKNYFEVDRELLTQRVKSLEGQLKKLKTTQISSQQTVSIEKLQNFYGKYLRANSRRKALVYQKNYLLCIVGSYQYCEENTLYVLAQLTPNQRLYTRLPQNKKVRFRIAVIAIISIHRMKWLIQRWRIGKRVGAETVMADISDVINLPVRKTLANYSPPVKERTTKGDSNFMLRQYYQEERNYQETFGPVMAESGTSHILSE